MPPLRKAPADASSTAPVAGYRQLTPAAGRSRLNIKTAALKWAAAAIVLLACGIGAYRLAFHKPSSALFRAPQFTKITITGNATAAAISPDGPSVAYALDEGGKFSLWVRQVSIANGVRILPQSNSIYRGLTFSRDGSRIYYVVYDNNQI